jgi:hypothetical protein
LSQFGLSPDQAEPQAPQQPPGLLEQVGSGAASITSSLAKPFVDTGRNIAGAAIQTPIMMAEGAAAGSGHNQLADTLEQARQAVQPVGLSDQQFQDIENDPEKAMRRQLGSSAQIGSYAIPFGAGTNVLTKAILPGALQASVYEGGREAANDEELSRNKIAGAGVVGGTTAGLMYGAGKLYNKITGAGDALQNASTRMDQGTRQISLKGTIDSAGDEKAINETLTRLGGKGSAQNQLEQLRPMMDTLEGQIDDFIRMNPDISVSKTDIQNEFLKNLQSTMRSGSLTNTQAKREVAGYLADLTKAAGQETGGELNLQTLVDAKRLINQDFKNIATKANLGNPLTPREQVVNIAWKSIDDAVKGTAPEVKNLLLDQSNLFKAAPELAAARFNPPTLRAAGFSIPQVATQGMRDLGSGMMNQSGRLLNALPEITPSTAGAVGAQVPKLLSPQPQTPDQQQNTKNGVPSVAVQQQPQGAGQQNIANGNPNSQNQPDGNQGSNQFMPPITTSTQPLRQSTTSNSITQPQQSQGNYITGHSPQEHYQAYQAALKAGDRGAATQIRQFFTDEQAYQKERAAGNKPPKLTSVQQTLMTNTTSGLRSVDKVEQLLRSDPSMILKGAVPGITGRVVGASTYTTARNEIADVLGRMRTGAVISPSELQLYLTKLPAPGDRQTDIDYKLTQLRQIFNDIQGRIQNTSGMNEQYQQTGGLPDITSGGYAQ